MKSETSHKLQVGDRVKVVSNNEMNTRGLMGRYGHIEELVTPEPGENPICRYCGQRFKIHTVRDASGLALGGVVFCFRSGNQMFEPLEQGQIAMVQFPDFVTHVEVKYLTVQTDHPTDG